MEENNQSIKEGNEERSNNIREQGCEVRMKKNIMRIGGRKGKFLYNKGL